MTFQLNSNILDLYYRPSLNVVCKNTIFQRQAICQITFLPDDILHPHIDSVSNDAERVGSWVLSQSASILLRNVRTLFNIT